MSSALSSLGGRMSRCYNLPQSREEIRGTALANVRILLETLRQYGFSQCLSHVSQIEPHSGYHLNFETIKNFERTLGTAGRFSLPVMVRGAPVLRVMVRGAPVLRVMVRGAPVLRVMVSGASAASGVEPPPQPCHSHSVLRLRTIFDGAPLSMTWGKNVIPSGECPLQNG